MSLSRHILLAGLFFGTLGASTGSLLAATAGEGSTGEVVTIPGTLAEGAGDSEETIARRDALSKLMGKGYVPMAAPPVDPDVAKLRAWSEAEDKKKYARPPTMFDDNSRAPPQEFLESLPLAIVIDLKDEYIWDSDDVRAISNALGYDAKKIPEHCQLRIDANFTSDKGFYHVRLLSGEQKGMKFDGALQKLALAPWAVCDKPEKALPKNPSLIGKVGKDKYSVPLSRPASCELPKEGVFTIEITYAGNGKVTCNFSSPGDSGGGVGEGGGGGGG